MPLLDVRGITKTYTTRLGASSVQALRGVTFSVERGEYVAIMGESGSGKTTLLNILSSLDTPTDGSVYLDGESITAKSEKELAAFRRDKIGFVFQEFNLLDTFSLRDNIYLPLVLSGAQHTFMEERLAPIAKVLGIEDILSKFPYEVSGGQKQRAAAARALITKPEIIFADEPTGALDSKAAQNLLGCFREINRRNQTIVMVTHSIKAAASSDRVMFIRDGKLYNQLYRASMSDDEMYAKISDTLVVLASGGGDNE